MRNKLFFLLAMFCFFSFQQPSLAQVEASTDNLFSFSEQLYLEIIVPECKLIAYKKGKEKLEKIAEFPVAPVREGASSYPEGKGFINKVELNPYWYPTNKTVEHMNAKLIARGKEATFKKGGAISPDDPRNAMGTFKMFLSHNVPGKGTIYRIHGTNAPQSIGKRASSGCVRMKNETGLPIAQNILQRLAEGQSVEVNIIMKKG